MPIIAITSAAMGTEAPRPRAVSGTIGRMAPSPNPNNSEGAKAGTAMRHRENEVAGEEVESAGGDDMRRGVRVVAVARLADKTA